MEQSQGARGRGIAGSVEVGVAFETVIEENVVIVEGVGGDGSRYREEERQG
jgi:hypothetical protein